MRKIANDPELKDIALEVTEMHGSDDMNASEKLEAEIESCHARLEIVGGGQHRDTLRMFEDRKKKIDQLSTKIAESTEKLEGICGGDCGDPRVVGA